MRRITELDAIRGLAALAVMIYHLKPEAFALHGIRVDLFLILSGFLITTIILRKGDGVRFLVTFSLRRWLRTWPNYFLALGLLVVANPWLPKTFPLDALPYYLTFTQNITRYWSNSVPPFNRYFAHTWSLALEEQFYLFWPAMVLLLGRRRLIPVALGLIVMSVVLRSQGFHWWLLLARCDGFGFGAVLAVIFLELESVERHRGRLQVGFGLSTLIAIPFVVATTIDTLEMDFGTAMALRPSLMIFAWNLLFFSLIGLVILNTGHPSLRILRNAQLSYLGKVSYGIYLYHSFVFIVLWYAGRALHLGQPLWLDVMKIVATIAVASLSWHWLEQPIVRFKERLRYVPATLATPQTQVVPLATPQTQVMPRLSRAGA
jgi:peptidoglycan/LPS O-acetylase OafA/YrhL